MLFIRLDPALWRRTLHFFREPDRGGLTKTRRGKKAYGALTNLPCSYNARQVFRQSREQPGSTTSVLKKSSKCEAPSTSRLCEVVITAENQEVL